MNKALWRYGIETQGRLQVRFAIPPAFVQAGVALAFAVVLASCGDSPAQLRSGSKRANDVAVSAAPIDLGGGGERVKTVDMVAVGSGVLVTAAAPPESALVEGMAVAWFDTSSQSWEELPSPPLTSFLSSHSEAVSQGVLTIATTCEGSFVEDVGCAGIKSVGAALFDTKVREWKTLPSLTTGQSALLAADTSHVLVHGGGQRKLVEVLGENLSARELWSLDAGTGTWTREPDPPLEPMVFCRTANDEDTYALAGPAHSPDVPAENTPPLQAFVLHSGKGEWTPLNSAPLPDNIGLPQMLCGTDSAAIVTAQGTAVINGGAIALKGPRREPILPSAAAVSSAKPGIVAVHGGLDNSEFTAVNNGNVRTMRVASHVSDAAVMEGGSALVLTRDLESGRPSWETLDVAPLLE